MVPPPWVLHPTVVPLWLPLRPPLCGGRARPPFPSPTTRASDKGQRKACFQPLFLPRCPCDGGCLLGMAALMRLKAAGHLGGSAPGDLGGMSPRVQCFLPCVLFWSFFLILAADTSLGCQCKWVASLCYGHTCDTCSCLLRF